MQEQLTTPTRKKERWMEGRKKGRKEGEERKKERKNISELGGGVGAGQQSHYPVLYIFEPLLSPGSFCTTRGCVEIDI